MANDAYDNAKMDKAILVQLDRENVEMQMFGDRVTSTDLRKAVIRGQGTGFTDAGMFAMSILSDAQECLAMGDTERARQYMNRAKFVINEFLRKPRG
jgi:hypothetical protein